MGSNGYARCCAVAVSAILITGCVNTHVIRPAPEPGQVVQPVVATDVGPAGVGAILPTPFNRAECATLAGADEIHVARLLDMPSATLTKLKRLTNTDNVGVCAMSDQSIRDTLIADRNSRRLPKAQRKLNKAAAKEYMLLWDADDLGHQPNATQVLNADAARKSLAARAETQAKAAGITQTKWTAIGPGNVGGRVRSVLIDPRDPNRILVGAVSGGIWRSTNGGTQFAPVADMSSNLTIGALAFDPSNPSTMYAGTGESYQGLLGIGMFKSTDNGTTWTFLTATSTDTAISPGGRDWSYVNRIGVSAANGNIVLAATDGGIFRSINAGQGWTQVYDTQTLDLQFDPFNPNNLMAGLNDARVAYSRDAGATWQFTAAPLVTPPDNDPRVRVEVVFARSKQNVAYASVQNNSGDIFKSLDGGVTWSFVSNPKHLGDQGGYANTIWVDPLNENHLVVGGLDLHRSTDGGRSFTKIADWAIAGPGLPQPHADHHVIVSAPNYSASNQVVYIGNDGGIFRSTDISQAGATGTTTWQNLNNGLAITQFYGGAGSTVAGGKIIGGTQDNGDLQLTTGTNWAMIGGGDGGAVAVDPIDDNVRYGEYVYGSVRRFVGGEARDICAGITESAKNCSAAATQRSNFISPFVLDSNARTRMLVGSDSLWLSEDVRTPDEPVWTTIKAPVAVPDVASHYINAVEVARGNANLIWVGHNATNQSGVPTHIYKTVNGRSATPTWQPMSSTGMPTSTVNRITIDPDNHNRVWVAYSGFSSNRLWLTEDGGANWKSISSGLPAVSLFDIKRHPTQRNWLYVAAANGVYTSEDAGTTWSASNDGPNSVRVRELFWLDAETLVAATFGRGMFQVKTSAATGPLNYSDMWWAGSTENGWGMSIQQHSNGVQFNAIYVYDAAGLPRWYVMPGGSWNSSFTTYSGAVYQPTSAPFNNYNTSQFVVGASSGTVSLTFNSLNTATMTYTINGVSGTKSIERQQFSAGTAPFNVADLWWAGTAENGWGINFAQQAGTIFGVWYTYGADGKNTWFVWPGGTWTGNTYAGALYSTTGSPWLGATYNASLLKVNPVGNLSVNFSSANAATMTYTFNAGPYAGTTQTKNLIRQPY